MLYFFGYVLSGFLIIAGSSGLLIRLHRNSKFGAAPIKPAQTPTMKSRAVITFSVILPFAALAFLLLCFNAMNIAQSLHLEGHYRYVVEALLLPTVCFLIGYSYFKRLVRF